MSSALDEAIYVASISFSFVFICLIILMYSTKLMSYITKTLGGKERKEV